MDRAERWRDRRRRSSGSRMRTRSTDGATVVVKLCRNSVMWLTRQVSPLLLCLSPSCLSLSLPLPSLLPLSPQIFPSPVSHPVHPLSVSLFERVQLTLRKMQMSLERSGWSGNTSLSMWSSAQECVEMHYRSVCVGGFQRGCWNRQSEEDAGGHCGL